MNAELTLTFFFFLFPDVQQVAVDIKNQIEEFKPNIPLIQALRNPGMRNRHWEMLTEELKLPVRPKKDLTFKKCLEMGFDKHIDKISKVLYPLSTHIHPDQIIPFYFF